MQTILTTLYAVALCGAQELPGSRSEPEVHGAVLVVAMLPEAIRLDKGQLLSRQLLIDRLSLRLKSRGIVVTKTSVNEPTRRATFFLVVSVDGGRVRLQLHDTQNELLIDRLIPLARRSVHDVAHAIALTVIERLAPVYEGMRAHLPPSNDPKTDFKLPTPPPRAAQHHPWNLSLDGYYALGLTYPTQAPLHGGGIELRAIRDRLLMSVATTVWSRITQREEDYSLRAQWGTLRGSVGTHYRWTSWSIGADVSALLRVVWNDQSGDRITPNSAWNLNAGIGARLFCLWLAYPNVGVRLSTGVDRFFPYQDLIVDERSALSPGATMISTRLALVWQFE